MNKFMRRLPIVLFWVSLILLAIYAPIWLQRPPHDRTITIMAWEDVLDPSVAAAFEKETGIKVRINHASSDEELVTKIKTMHGKGCDLLIPSDFSLRQLHQEGLLKPIDPARVPFLEEIHPFLREATFDAGGPCAIPFAWEMIGFGVDTQYASKSLLDPSLRWIFDPHSIHYKIAMVNHPIEALQLASLYLFGPRTSVSEEEMTQLQALLTQQKQWVEAYSDFRADYFLTTKNCPIVVGSSAAILKAKKKYKFIDFVLPKEGGLLITENLCIPKATEKDDLVYAFIQYLFRSQSMEANFRTSGNFPAVSWKMTELGIPLPTSSAGHENLYLIRNLFPQQEVYTLWVQVKSEHASSSPTPLIH